MDADSLFLRGADSRREKWHYWVTCSWGSPRPNHSHPFLFKLLRKDDFLLRYLWMTISQDKEQESRKFILICTQSGQRKAPWLAEDPRFSRRSLGSLNLSSRAHGWDWEGRTLPLSSAMVLRAAFLSAMWLAYSKEERSYYLLEWSPKLQITGWLIIYNSSWTMTIRKSRHWEDDSVRRFCYKSMSICVHIPRTHAKRQVWPYTTVTLTLEEQRQEDLELDEHKPTWG